MITATWRAGRGEAFYKGVDAQKVADEITGIGESVSPQDIVNRARDETSELHKCFEWDDTKAAEKWRIQQARQITYFLVIKEDEKPHDRPEVRFFVTPKNGEGYKKTEYVVKIDSEYEKLLKQAWAELRAFKQRYSTLKELQEIFDLIE